MKRLFHYTTASRLQQILTDKEIKLATLYVEKGERAVVWCSYRQDWEPTATPRKLNDDGSTRQITFAELCEIETPARIEIEPEAAPLNWIAWKENSGVRDEMAKQLELIARRENSNCDDWKMSFKAIRFDRWLGIELFVNGEWQDIEKFIQPKAKP